MNRISALEIGSTEVDGLQQNLEALRSELAALKEEVEIKRLKVVQASRQVVMHSTRPTGGHRNVEPEHARRWAMDSSAP